MLRRTRSSLLIASALSFSPLSLSSGFPTVDVANLLQSIMEYQTVLQEYSQILKQTGLDANELITAINEYEQMLREYQILLSQVESLKGKIDRRDYPAIERELRRLRDQYSGSATTSNHAYSEARFGKMIPKGEFVGLSRQVLGEMPDSHNQQYMLATESHRQGAALSHFQERQTDLVSARGQLDDLRLGLGDKSELATLQMAVEQNQVLLDQLSLQTDVAVAQYASSDQLESRVSNAILRAQKAKLELVKRTREQGITLDERPLR